MFDKNGFKSILNHSTGYAYCSGLNSIETIFQKDIDAEFQKDSCVSLLEMLKQAHDSADSQKRSEFSRYQTQLRKYIAFKQGASAHTGAAPVDFEASLDLIISEYKKGLPGIRDQERYKWEAIQWFQTHWDEKATNFPAMLTEAFSKASNLLVSAMYYPLRMVQEYAAEDPETVRSLFIMLYDESLPLEKRYVDFRAGFQKRIDVLKKDRTKSLQHYQDLRAIMVYLTFRYPEKYYFYKATMFSTFKERTGYVETRYAGRSIVDKINSFNHMCDLILDRVTEDSELISMSRALLTDDCYADDSLHILTMDLVFYGSYYMDEKLFSAPPVENTPEESMNQDTEASTDVGLNTILYGPPGTGKTYQTVLYAVAIIEDKPLDSIRKEKYKDVLLRYQQYRKQNRIAFTTFHQSYSYEEFIEGIRPVSPEDNELEASGSIQYKIMPGIFRQFCARAEAPASTGSSNAPTLNSSSTIWKVSLGGTGDNSIRSECLANDHIRIGWDDYGPDITDETDFSVSGGRIVLNTFINRMQIGDVVLSCYSATTIDAIGIVTGEYEWHSEYNTMRRLRKVHWLASGIRENILDLNGGITMTLSSVYRLSNISPENVADLLQKYKHTENLAPVQKQNYVFIIDEINRGNISRIFGELITLIEPAKRIGRAEGIKALLPYSRTLFGIPDNVYLIGTMNTADRSIAALDAALRRRFQFREILPDARVLSGIMVEDVSISELLTRMNRRIAALYDREHMIGHAYFMPLAADPTIETLSSIFENNIIPLLQEYFYEDYGKIRLVLGDNQKQDPETQFILRHHTDYTELFGNTDEEIDCESSYEINHAALSIIDSYRSI